MTMAKMVKGRRGKHTTKKSLYKKAKKGYTMKEKNQKKRRYVGGNDNYSFIYIQFMEQNWAVIRERLEVTDTIRDFIQIIIKVLCPDMPEILDHDQIIKYLTIINDGVNTILQNFGFIYDNLRDRYIIISDNINPNINAMLEVLASNNLDIMNKDNTTIGIRALEYLNVDSRESEYFSLQALHTEIYIICILIQYLTNQNSNADNENISKIDTQLKNTVIQSLANTGYGKNVNTYIYTKLVTEHLLNGGVGPDTLQTIFNNLSVFIFHTIDNYLKRTLHVGSLTPIDPIVVNNILNVYFKENPLVPINEDNIVEAYSIIYKQPPQFIR